MNEQIKDPLTNPEKVQILIQEYNTLRQEIIQRTNQGFQTYGVGAVLFVWLASHTSFDQRFWIILFASVLVLSLAARVTRNEIRKVAQRVVDLEKIINGLAGDTLLTWETSRGGAEHGPRWFWGAAKNQQFDSNRNDRAIAGSPESATSVSE